MTVNVLIITRYFFPVRNGLADHTELLRQLWSASGGKVTVLCEAAGGKHGPAASAPAEESRVYTYSGRIDMLKTMSVAIKEQRPDMVLFQYVPHMWGRAGIAPLAAFVPLFVGAFYGIPSAAYLHELFYNWSLHPRKLLPAVFHRLQLVPIALASRMLIVTNAKRERRLKRGFWKHKVYRLPCGNISGRKDAASCGSPYPWPYVTWFGTLSADQRLEELIHAFALVSEKHRELRLVLVGGYDPESQRMQRLASDVRRYGVEHRVLFRGFADESELSDILHGSAANLFVAESGPSGRRSVVAAYCKSGKAVIAFDGFETDPEFIHRENIWLAPVRDSGALADGMLQVIENRELRSRLEKGAHQLYAGHFSDQAILQKLNRVYDWVVHGQSRGGTHENSTNCG